MNAKGYAIWQRQMQPLLQELLGRSRQRSAKGGAGPQQAYVEEPAAATSLYSRQLQDDALGGAGSNLRR
jgi:hypothetical protein